MNDHEKEFEDYREQRLKNRRMEDGGRRVNDVRTFKKFPLDVIVQALLIGLVFIAMFILSGCHTIDRLANGTHKENDPYKDLVGDPYPSGTFLYRGLIGQGVVSSVDVTHYKIISFAIIRDEVFYSVHFFTEAQETYQPFSVVQRGGQLAFMGCLPTDQYLVVVKKDATTKDMKVDEYWKEKGGK